MCSSDGTSSCNDSHLPPAHIRRYLKNHDPTGEKGQLFELARKHTQLLCDKRLKEELDARQDRFCVAPTPSDCRVRQRWIGFLIGLGTGALLAGAILHAV